MKVKIIASKPPEICADISQYIGMVVNAEMSEDGFMETKDIVDENFPNGFTLFEGEYEIIDEDMEEGNY